MSRRVLIIEDDPTLTEVLALRLGSWGYETCCRAEALEVENLLPRFRPHLVLSDVVLPDTNGLDLVQRLQRLDPALPVVLMTAHGGVEMALEAIKKGAIDFLTKPLDYTTLRALLESVAAENELRAQTSRVRRRLELGAGFDGFVGVSASMRRVYKLIEQIAATDAPVLVTGESGTGKELVVQALHRRSTRRDGPIVALNAAAIPSELIESEVFGAEAGAFTGARRRRAGCFEQADRGTLFLDEIAEMPASLQPKLLRVLETGRVRRLGGEGELAVDVRVIAATNRALPEAVDVGLLRADLFYRLSVFQVELPPLRRRSGDVGLLVQHFIDRFNQKHGAAVEGAHHEVLDRLTSYRWPGNVRELRNVMERAVVLARGGWLMSEHLPPYLQPASAALDPGLRLPARTSIAEAEQRLILHTLEHSGQNKAEAARRLGVDVKTIRNKLKRYGLSP